MSLVYGEDKFFIGMIKFFDSAKGFGYIASNNCGMRAHNYEQDFYVNHQSFVEDDAKKEGRVVVFQVDKQDDGKKRAVNVRKISPTEEDYRLALSYYEDHEKIGYKDGRVINLFNHTGVPRKMVGELVMSRIKEDPERSPQKTVEHIKFYLKHYREYDISFLDPGFSFPYSSRHDYPRLFPSNRYVFDRDFEKEEKNIWYSLVSILTDEEVLELLKVYPSFCKYIDNSDLLRNWVLITYSESSSLDDLSGLNELLRYLPEEVKNEANRLIEETVDKKIEGVLLETENDEHASKLLLEQNLKPYLRLTSNKHEEDVQRCLKRINYKGLNKKMSKFLEHPYDIYERRGFFDALNALGEVASDHRDELEPIMRDLLERYISDKKYAFAASLLECLDFLGADFVDSYKARLKPLVTETLKDSLQADIANPYKVEKDFFEMYHSMTSIYDEEAQNDIKSVLVPIMLQTDSLSLLSVSTTGEGRWLLSHQDALKRCAEVVSTWKYDKLSEFLNRYSSSSLFYGKPDFQGIIVDKAIEIIQDYPLSEFFDGTNKDENDGRPFSRNPERENCEFLRKLENFISSEHREKWEQYIQSRSEEDLIILYKAQIIAALPDKVAVYIVNSITLESVMAIPTQWYYAPTLVKDIYGLILQDTTADLFPIIADRLVKLEYTSSNIPLAVLLAELMSANRPKDDDYYSQREWDNNFSINLQRLKESQPNNSILSVVLWAVYSRTKASSSSLKEVIPELPPYLQFKCVRKLFMLMSQGKIRYTAEQLYDLITSPGKKLCFPLEIAFYYLKMREKNPDATLNNNHMLELLNGRDDHPEWVEVRYLMSQCNGRWITKELEYGKKNWKHGRYYNGRIVSERNEIKVFVPNKMIDDSGDLTEYNNKYKEKVPELIKLTYREEEYKLLENPSGKLYVFNQSSKIDLFTIARYFNFEFGRLDNYLGFETKPDDDELFCECRMSEKGDNDYGISFYWCRNKPCYRPPLRYMLDSEWERYTILDFMRILNIPTDYVNKSGKTTRYGHYIILSSYMRNFVKFYERLKCRECGKLMKPIDLSNFATRAITEFQCDDEGCKEYGKTVYLNNCFNRQKCNAIIDSRDSAKCPNGQYICPDCGACCSTENFKHRILHLRQTGGYVSDWLVDFVDKDKGHWERGERFCWHCGSPVTREDGKCDKCGAQYGVKFVVPSPAPAPINENIQQEKEIPDDDLPF